MDDTRVSNHAHQLFVHYTQYLHCAGDESGTWYSDVTRSISTILYKGHQSPIIISRYLYIAYWPCRKQPGEPHSLLLIHILSLYLLYYRKQRQPTDWHQASSWKTVDHQAIPLSAVARKMELVLSTKRKSTGNMSLMRSQRRRKRKLNILVKREFGKRSPHQL